MMKMYYLVVLLFSVLSCSTEAPKRFSKEALNDTFLTSQGNSKAFKDILKEHQGKVIVIDVWASWCGDCIAGLPDLKNIQNQYSEATYVFLSLDRNVDTWKQGIAKYKIEGEHYFMQSGKNGPFGEFINLGWIPRYIIVNKKGEIELFDATHLKGERFIKSLKSILINK